MSLKDRLKARTRRRFGLGSAQNQSAVAAAGTEPNASSPANPNDIKHNSDLIEPRRSAGALQKKTVEHAAIPGAFAQPTFHANRLFQRR